MPVEYDLHDGILHVVINNPPVNALSASVREGLIAAIDHAEAIGARAVIIQGTNSRFIAGADVREFGLPPIPPHLPEVVNRIEAASMPVVAAIEGQALGGGLEVALACHLRIAASDARLGLPEVSLGLVPGAGGTQRLPRLVDPLIAAEMIAEGKPISAQRALQVGLINHLVDGDLANAARSLASGVDEKSLGTLRLSGRDPEVNENTVASLDEMVAKLRKSARGALAPIEAVRLVRTACTRLFADGMASERETFLRLRDSEQAAALRHIFFAERAAAKLPPNIVGATSRPVRSVGVVGAGTMGSGIAISIADAGIPVTIVENSTGALHLGMQRITDAYAASVERGRLNGEEAGRRLKLIAISEDYAALADCDLVIEAAYEDIEVKRQIFEHLDEIVKPGAILASNTSYLDLDRIAAFTRRPGDVVGLHYFSPANVMRLLEVVRGKETRPEVLATALAFAKRTGKQAVVAGVCRGFIGNRMLQPYVREAGLLVLEGAMPWEVDDALEQFGMAMGPFAVADLSGIDIGYKARKALASGSYDPAPFALHDSLVEAGELGRKTGAGFYTYQEGSRSREPNLLVVGLIDKLRTAAGVSARVIRQAEIVERCLRALVVEGGHLLSEGIAARPGDIDVVYVNGYGFPRQRGGPMFWHSSHNEFPNHPNGNPKAIEL